MWLNKRLERLEDLAGSAPPPIDDDTDAGVLAHLRKCRERLGPPPPWWEDSWPGITVDEFVQLSRRRVAAQAAHEARGPGSG